MNKREIEIEDYEAMLREINLICQATLNEVREKAKKELPGYIEGLLKE
ncbi:MAG: hypothetical protein K0S93_181 [Nitrososphaeraceae archaeon]|nr:hypothetical protein [Nitrososphaeraceae archaeon]